MHKTAPNKFPRPLAHRLGRGRPARWWLAGLALLLVVGPTVGASPAADDPNWRGTKPKNISENPVPMTQQPDVAAGSGRVLVAWSGKETVGGFWDIYSTYSDNGGLSWTAPKEVYVTTSDSRWPDTLLIGTRRFVAWIDGEASLAEMYETEIGTGEVRTVSSPMSVGGTRPRLAASPGRLHIVFNSLEPQSIVYHSSRALTDAAWPMAKPVYTSTAGSLSLLPTIAIDADGTTAHLVWRQYAYEQKAIMYAQGTIAGSDVSWTPATTLATASTDLVRPAVVVDSTGVAHVTWGEAGEAGHQEEQYVRYAHYADSAWSSPVRVDPNRVAVFGKDPTYVTPDMSIWEDEGEVTVCVSWHGFREGEIAEEVLLSCSHDGGQTWPPPQNMSRSPGDDYPDRSIFPSIAFGDTGVLHGAWQERVAGSDNYEIFYSRSAGSEIFLPFVAKKG
jgi:hypothetical protein